MAFIQIFADGDYINIDNIASFSKRGSTGFTIFDKSSYRYDYDYSSETLRDIKFNEFLGILILNDAPIYNLGSNNKVVTHKEKAVYTN